MGAEGFEYLKKQDIKEQVFQQLLSKIQSGEWKPGEKLPSENELTKAMGVSRITVREAIQKLVAINLVETYQGKGSFVKNVNSITPTLTLFIISDEWPKFKRNLCFRRKIPDSAGRMAVPSCKERKIGVLCL